MFHIYQEHTDVIPFFSIDVGKSGQWVSTNHLSPQSHPSISRGQPISWMPLIGQVTQTS